MQRIHEDYLAPLENIVPLTDKHILEIGCGNGTRSIEIARRCESLVGVDADPATIARANERQIPNAIFQIGSAELLPFKDKMFDEVIYAFSFHHVPSNLYEQAIHEAIRVVRQGGHIIFLELTNRGSSPEAEQNFGSGIDECAAKDIACTAILASPSLQVTDDIGHEMFYKFDSLDDFLEVRKPSNRLAELPQFLKKHDYLLNSWRRIIIAVPSR